MRIIEVFCGISIYPTMEKFTKHASWKERSFENMDFYTSPDRKTSRNPLPPHPGTP
jgi:hypothetical protein